MVVLKAAPLLLYLRGKLFVVGFISFLKKILMNKVRLTLIFCVFIIIYGCSSSHIVTTWKPQHYSAANYNNILIVGVVKDEDGSFRTGIETHFVNDLQDLGYHAVSALGEFGPKGLTNLGEAETYLKLCNKGIDAVITVALIDKEKEIDSKSHGASGYPAKYYYDRIWNYKNMQAEFSDQSSGRGNCFWEIILFDLVTLEPQCTIQTRPSDITAIINNSSEFLKQVIQKMLKEKILKKQENKVTTQLKAF
jgi:hypothetical protein